MELDPLDLGLRGDLNCLAEIAFELKPGLPGATVFLAGDEGSGRTAILRALADVLGRKGGRRVILGSFEGGTYVAQSHLGRDLGKARTLVEGVLTMAGPLIPLIGQIVTVSNGARKLVEGLAGDPSENHPLALVPELLRRAAISEGPLVCLIDDADRSDRGWWADLIMSFGQQVAVDLPLFLVFAMRGPAQLGSHQSDEPDALFVAKQLVKRGIATYRPIPTHSVDEFDVWIGGSNSGLAKRVTDATHGRAIWSAELWEEWSRQGVVRRVDGRWSATEADSPSPFGAAGLLLSRRIRTLLDDRLDLVSEAQELLSGAALEGREFTADALAISLGRDPDEVIDFFDDRLADSEREPGIVEEKPTLTIVDQGGKRHLRRYRFCAELDYLATRQYGYPDRSQLEVRALSSAQALHDLYGAESPRIAHVLAELADRGGDREAAGEFRRMHRIATDRTTALLRAQMAMGLSEGAGQAEKNRAAEVLIAGALALYHSGPWKKGLAFGEKAAGITNLESLRATALYYAAWSAMHLEDRNKARRYLQDALREFEALRNRDGVANALHQLANLDMEAGRLDEAEAGYRSSLEIREARGDREMVARVHEALGDLGKRKQNPAQARAEYEIALAIALEIGDRHSWATTRCRIAELDYEAERFEECRAPLDEILSVHREYGDRRTAVVVLRLLSNACYALERYEEARDAAAHAAKVIDETELAEGAAAHIQAGQAESAMGNHAAAKASFLKALGLRERTSEQTMAALMAMADLALDKEEFLEARRFLDEALRVAVDSGDRGVEGRSRRLIGDILRTEENWGEARRSYLLAAPLQREEGNFHDEAMSLFGLGCIAYELEKLDEAGNFFEEALPAMVEFGESSLEACMLTYLGLLDSVHEEFDDARARLRDALRIYRELEDRESEESTRRLLAEVELDAASR